jgi:hypothetical protein
VPHQMVIGNVPSADVSHNREITSREDDLFGEKYPEATLKALGLEKPKPAKKAKPKSKKTKAKSKKSKGTSK